MDRIAAVIVHAHGITWTSSLMVELAERGVLTVLCAVNHAPKALLWPIEGHHAQGARLRAQWSAPKPLIKQAWKALVQAKLAMQSAALQAVGQPHAPVASLIPKVRSGEVDMQADIMRRRSDYVVRDLLASTISCACDSESVEGFARGCLEQRLCDFQSFAKSVFDLLRAHWRVPLSGRL